MDAKGGHSSQTPGVGSEHQQKTQNPHTQHPNTPIQRFPMGRISLSATATEPVGEKLLPPKSGTKSLKPQNLQSPRDFFWCNFPNLAPKPKNLWLSFFEFSLKTMFFFPMFFLLHLVGETHKHGSTSQRWMGEMRVPN